MTIACNKRIPKLMGESDSVMAIHTITHDCHSFSVLTLASKQSIGLLGFPLTKRIMDFNFDKSFVWPKRCFFCLYT